MKPIKLIALLGAFTSIAAHGAYTTPVGYYEFDAAAGSTICVPSLVKPTAFAGPITGSGATTLDFAASTFTGGEFDAGASHATHYVEITSGPNAGVVVDIASNTTAQITLADDITALALGGTESVTVRPHVTLGGLFEGDEADLGVFASNATFYFPDGSTAFYFFTGTIWSSDGVTPDGEDLPIPPGTGFVLQNTGVSLTVTGEVKATPTVVQVGDSSFVNIVGSMNPLVGNSTLLTDIGFDGLAPFGADTVVRYSADGLLAPLGLYFVTAGGELSTDLVNPTTDTIPNTTGAIIQSAAGAAVTVDPSLP